MKHLVRIFESISDDEFDNIKSDINYIFIDNKDNFSTLFVNTINNYSHIRLTIKSKRNQAIDYRVDDFRESFVRLNDYLKSNGYYIEKVIEDYDRIHSRGKLKGFKELLNSEKTDLPEELTDLKNII